MDLKVLYTPLIADSTTPSQKNSHTLNDLRSSHRNILGIEKSLRAKNPKRSSATQQGLYKIKSTYFTIFRKSGHGLQGHHKHCRIANFGLRQFKNDKQIRNILFKTLPIGDLSRTFHFFQR